MPRVGLRYGGVKLNYYLIDFENVHDDGIKEINGISAGDIVAIFYSDHCKNIGLDTIAEVLSKDAQLKVFRVSAGTKNALDFQLSCYIGYLIGKEGAHDAKFYIVSNDKGYDCLCEPLKSCGLSISRLTTKSNPTKGATPKEKASKVADKDIATLAEMKSVLAKEDKPEEVLEVFNQYKSKTEINNGLVKIFKDTKKTGNVYKKLKPLIKKKNKS